MHYASKLAMTCATLAFSVGQASAATFAAFNLIVRIPVSCEIDAGNARLAGNKLLLSIRRTCNTSHAIVITGKVAGEDSNLIVHFDNDTVDLGGGTAILPQPERYFDGVDEVSIESPTADHDQLVEFMQSMQIRVEVD